MKKLRALLGHFGAENEYMNRNGHLGLRYISVTSEKGIDDS